MANNRANNVKEAEGMSDSVKPKYCPLTDIGRNTQNFCMRSCAFWSLVFKDCLIRRALQVFITDTEARIERMGKRESLRRVEEL